MSATQKKKGYSVRFPENLVREANSMAKKDQDTERIQAIAIWSAETSYGDQYVMIVPDDPELGGVTITLGTLGDALRLKDVAETQAFIQEITDAMTVLAARGA